MPSISGDRDILSIIIDLAVAPIFATAGFISKGIRPFLVDHHLCVFRQ